VTSVFVSHSRRDKDIVNYFSQVFARTKLEAQLMELEDIVNKYQGLEIANKIRNDTSAVIVLLGESLLHHKRSAAAFRRSWVNHTRNWISFEIGVAAGCRKPVWVFEGITRPIKFPIPFLTDYYRYKIGDPRQIRTIGDILENKILNSESEIRTPIGIICPNCIGEFNYWTYTQSMCCPICRRPMDLGGLEEGHPYVKPHKRLPKFIKLLSASMTYKENKYPLDTNYYIKNNNAEVVSRIGNPHKGDPTEQTLKVGEVLIFHFPTRPLSVDAFLVDFEADNITTIAIPKEGANRFRLENDHSSIYNLQIYTVYPKKLEVVYSKYIAVDARGRRPSNASTDYLEIENIIASQKDYNNRPSNAIDGKEDTFWSGNKKGSWIQADLGRIKLIHNLEILWHNGRQKLAHFEVSFSKDGIKFEDPIRFVSTGSTIEEIFSVDEPNPQQGRYLRLTLITIHVIIILV
jgi:hypothetical protein